MKTKRKWLSVITSLVLVTPVLIAGVVIGLQIHQDILDRSLIAAVEKLDAPATTLLLNRGANANARETDAPPLTLQLILERMLNRLQSNQESSFDRGQPVLSVLLATTSNQSVDTAA